MERLMTLRRIETRLAVLLARYFRCIAVLGIPGLVGKGDRAEWWRAAFHYRGFFLFFQKILACEGRRNAPVSRTGAQGCVIDPHVPRFLPGVGEGVVAACGACPPRGGFREVQGRIRLSRFLGLFPQQLCLGAGMEFMAGPAG